MLVVFWTSLLLFIFMHERTSDKTNGGKRANYDEAIIAYGSARVDVLWCKRGSVALCRSQRRSLAGRLLVVSYILSVLSACPALVPARVLLGSVILRGIHRSELLALCGAGTRVMDRLPAPSLALKGSARGFLLVFFRVLLRLVCGMVEAALQVVAIAPRK